MSQFNDETVRLRREDLCKKIREFRGDKKQETLAKEMGINRETISKIENGKFAFSIDYLIRLAHHLDFEIVLSGKGQGLIKKEISAK